MTPTATAPSELELRRAEVHEVVANLPAEVRAQPVLLRGFAVPELVKAVGLGVDLLVVGTQVRGHVRRLFHNSVAGELALEASCPVLICPSSMAAATGGLDALNFTGGVGENSAAVRGRAGAAAAGIRTADHTPGCGRARISACGRTPTVGSALEREEQR